MGRIKSFITWELKVYDSVASHMQCVGTLSRKNHYDNNKQFFLQINDRSSIPYNPARLLWLPTMVVSVYVMS